MGHVLNSLLLMPTLYELYNFTDFINSSVFILSSLLHIPKNLYLCNVMKRFVHTAFFPLLIGLLVALCGCWQVETADAAVVSAESYSDDCFEQGGADAACDAEIFSTTAQFASRANKAFDGRSRRFNTNYHSINLKAGSLPQCRVATVPCALFGSSQVANWRSSQSLIRLGKLII